MEISGRFSQHARRAMMEARQCARDQYHIEVDTSHLLAGILLAEGSLGQRALRDLNLTSQSTIQKLALIHERRYDPARAGQPVSDALQAAMRAAIEESRLLGHHYIGTEHLLLGMARSGEGGAKIVLSACDISLDQLRRQVKRVLQDGETEIGLEKAVRLARLSELSRRVLSRAVLIAEDLHQEPVDLMHLLLALAQERRSPAARLLTRCGLDEIALTKAIAQPRQALPDDLEIVLDEAVFAAERAGSHYTGTDHIILTLTRHRHGARLLHKYGVDVTCLRRSIDHLLRPRRP